MGWGARWGPGRGEGCWVGGNGPGPVLGHQVKERGGGLDSQREEPPKPASCLPAWPGWVRTLTGQVSAQKGQGELGRCGRLGRPGGCWPSLGSETAARGDWDLPETRSREQSQGAPCHPWTWNSQHRPRVAPSAFTALSTGGGRAH